MTLFLHPTRTDNGDERIKCAQLRFNAQHSGAATVPQVLMGLRRVYDPTWRVKEGHLLPVSDPEKVCFGCPKSAAMIFSCRFSASQMFLFFFIFNIMFVCKMLT